MRYAMLASLTILGLGTALCGPGASAQTTHRIDCSNPANAHLAACIHRTDGSRGADATTTGGIVAPSASVAPPPNALTGLNCNDTPENMLEYYCNHRDQFPSR
jgi:hypothetical protein